ncbi:MAG: acyl-CoA thioesterase domain-containing protein [Actinomycetota bacterium]
MSGSYFEVEADGFAPTIAARGPWAADMLHGRLIGGLAARELEVGYGQEGWRLARLTVDLFRPAGMVPVQVATEVIRRGRRVLVVDGLVSSDGRPVARGTAVFLPESSEPPGRIWRPAFDAWPDPASLVAAAGTIPDEVTGWLVQEVDGGFGTGERTRLWSIEHNELVAGEPITPAVRAALAADIGCPLANSSDEGLHYINADYTLLLGRYPRGSWIGIEVAQQIAASGVSVATATMYDQAGPFATSGGTSLSRPPLVVDN